MGVKWILTQMSIDTCNLDDLDETFLALKGRGSREMYLLVGCFRTQNAKSVTFWSYVFVEPETSELQNFTLRMNNKVYETLKNAFLLVAEKQIYI